MDQRPGDRAVARSGAPHRIRQELADGRRAYATRRDLRGTADDVAERAASCGSRRPRYRVADARAQRHLERERKMDVERVTDRSERPASKPIRSGYLAERGHALRGL